MPEDVATYLFDSGVIVGLYYGVILWDYTIYGPMGLDYVYGFSLSNILGSITIHDDKSYENKASRKGRRGADVDHCSYGPPKWTAPPK